MTGTISLHSLYLLLLTWLSVVAFPMETLAGERCSEVGPTRGQQQRVSDVDTRYRLAAGFYEREQWSEAADAFQKINLEFPDTPQAQVALFYLGECRFQESRWQDARIAYQSFVLATPNHALVEKAYFRVAEIAYRQQASETSELFEHFLTSFPNSHWREYSLHYLGQRRLQESSPTLAKAVFERALREFPEGAQSLENRLGLALALEQCGDAVQALRFLDFVANHAVPPLSTDAAFRAAILQLRIQPDETAYRRLTAAAESLPPDDPRSGEAWFHLARFHFLRAQYQQAADAFQCSMARAASDEIRMAALHDLAMTQLHLGQTTEASQTFDRLAHEFPESPLMEQAAVYRAKLAFNQGETKALLEMDTAHLSAADQIQVRELQGRSQYAQGEYAAAIQTFADLLAAFPDDAAKSTWQYFMGISHLAVGDGAQANRLLQDIDVESLPPNLRTRFLLASGTAAQHLQEWDRALERFRLILSDQSASTDDPTVHSAATGMLLCQIARQDLPETLGAFESLSEESRSQLPAGTLQRIADLALALDDSMTAMRFYRLATQQEIDPTLQNDAWFGLGYAALQGRDAAMAADAFSRVEPSVLEGNRAQNAQLSLARLHDEQSLWSASAAAYARAAALAVEPQVHILAKLRQGIALRKCGDPISTQQAWAILSEVASQPFGSFPRDYALYELFWIERTLGREQAAERRLRELVNRFPASELWPDAAYRLARRELAGGRPDPARELLRQLESQTESPELLSRVHFLRGQIESQEKNWPAVAASMNAVLEIPTSREAQLRAQYWLAEAQFQMGNHQIANDHFLQLLSEGTFPDPAVTPWLVLRTCQGHVYLQQWKLAQQLAQQALNQFTTFPQRYEFALVLGRCEFTAGNLTDAIALFRSVTESPTGQGTESAAQAEWRMGEALFLQQKFTEALESYYRVESLYAFPYWQAAALLQAGKCQEKLKQFRQAELLYNNLLKKFPDSEFADDARQRISLLNRQVKQSGIPLSNYR